MRGERRRRALRSLLLSVLVCSLGISLTPGAATELPGPIVLTQVPLQRGEAPAPLADGTLPADYFEKARIILIEPGSEARVLTGRFHSARDPRISFDGERLLLAAKRRRSSDWDIYEIPVAGGAARRITRRLGNCHSPVYQGSMYVIVSDRPWDLITFASDHAQELNEYGPSISTSLYSCKPDGSDVRRLTYSPSSDLNPTVLPDGRLLFSSWQRSTLARGLLGRVSLFAAMTDGIDNAIFSGDEGLRVKLMPCVTADRLVVFVEGNRMAWDGSGTLASVRLSRNLRSYRRITREGEGLFHSPSPLPNGDILVSRRSEDGSGSHGLYRMDPESGRIDLLFDDPDYQDIQAGLVAPRPLPDGRSSVVTPGIEHGLLYGLNVYISDVPRDEWVKPGTPLRLRVLEGIPRHESDRRIYLASDGRRGVDDPGSTQQGLPSLLQRRFLGEVPVEEDGSFNMRIPANTPVELQLIDDDGLALRSCSWIWTRNRETRGCIGCHENAELTPENRFVDALGRLPTDLMLPPERRRTVDFRRDVMPIVRKKCASAGCHGGPAAKPLLGEDPANSARSGKTGPFNHTYVELLAAHPASDAGASPYGLYVHPGRARTSPLVFHLFGRDTSRPWDGSRARPLLVPMPPAGMESLTDDERRTIVEWIDLGALWDGIPENEPRSSRGATEAGGFK
jgi:hypothetical protein